MRNEHRVVWTKGMFLIPQHFQTQDQYFEDTLQFRFAVSNYANWGITALSVDGEALANGLFRLTECRGIMPDGLAFHMPDVDELPASREVHDFFPPNEKELDVYLSIPEQRYKAPNVTIPSKDDAPGLPDTRYVAQPTKIADHNAGVDEKDVQLARKNFRLLFRPENRAGFTSLRIAQVVRTAAGLCVLKPSFIAPCLDIAHNEYAMGLMRRQLEILATKSDALAASRRERDKAVADFSASETASFWLLHTVNSFIPELRHIWSVRHGHPETAYVAMLRLAGALTTFSLDTRPQDLPAYDHNDLGGCFTELDNKIRHMMRMLFKEKYIALQVVGPGPIWTATVPESRFFSDSQFFLAVSSGALTKEGVVQKVTKEMRVASPLDIDRLIKKALPGVKPTLHPTPPTEIPIKQGNQYFALDQGGELWNNVKGSGEIAIFDGGIEDLKMEVIIVLQ